MVNFLGIMQNEWAGAQAFSSFDTYLAPFVRIDNLSQKEVKQCIQSFIYGVNTPSRWGSVIRINRRISLLVAHQPSHPHPVISAHPTLSSWSASLLSA